MPAPGSALEQAVLALAEQRPLLRARDLAALGLPTMALLPPTHAQNVKLAAQPPVAAQP